MTGMVFKYGNMETMIENVEYFGHEPFCTIHKTNVYSEKYDSYYCPECRRWLDEKRTESEFGFCSDRPIKPNDIHGF